MNNNINPLARKNAYMEFIHEAITKSDTKSIKDWVDNNMKKDQNQLDQTLINIFLSAEEELYQSFLTKGEIDKVQKLAEFFSEYQEPLIRKFEFKVITNALKSTKDQISSGDKNNIKNIFEQYFSYANEEDSSNTGQSKMKSMWDETMKLLGEIE